MWSEQGNVSHQVTSGHPGRSNSSAAAVLAYDVPHRAPWDWRLSLYTWTKSIAAGVYLLPLLLVLLDEKGVTSPLWQWVAPIVAGVFLALTGLILIADLDHPQRFYLIFTRPQWKSWLVRGAFIIAGYAAVLLLHFLANFSEKGESLQARLMVPGLLLSALTVVYTAYLFAQATARDLWQSPLLPIHFLIQAFLAGTAVLLPFALWLEPALVSLLTWTLGAASLLHLLSIFGEITLAHPTAHAQLAAAEMISGAFRWYFWGGVALVVVGMTAPWIGVLAVPFALVGLLAHEHAYVQAGQAVPLA
jgi:formate-dependent nitrite reductase membrane component NrfD